MDNTKKPVFIHSQELEKYRYPPDSMFDTQRAAKTRELLISLGLLEGKCGRESAPVPATKSELKNFHSAKYLDIDAHHGDGVQEAFYTSNQVMVISLHESDIALGMGGVMLQSTEWSGGLRDRVLPMDEQHCEAVETAIQATIRSLIRNVFEYHGI